MKFNLSKNLVYNGNEYLMIDARSDKFMASDIGSDFLSFLTVTFGYDAGQTNATLEAKRNLNVDYCSC